MSFTYGANGKIATAADKLGNITGYQYHPRFRDSITKVTSPAPFNYEAVFTYDSATGSLLTKTTPLGKTTTYTYYTEGVKKGLLHTVTDPNSNTTSLDYDLYGNLTTITDPLGKETTITYDSLGRAKTVTDALGNVAAIFYDIAGNMIKALDPDGKEMQMSYDCLNRTIATINALNQSSVIQYDAGSNVIKTVNPEGKEALLEYDIFDNVIKLTDTEGRFMSFTYDKKSRLLKSFDPMGRITEYSYDPYCGTTTKTDAVGLVTKTYTDLLCRTTRREYENSNAFNFTYDQLGRLTQATPDGPKYGDVIYGGADDYGAGTYGSFKYGDEGLIYGYNPDDILEYIYDSDDRLIEIKMQGNLAIYYQYDNGGRLTQLTDVNGSIVQYEYTANNQLHKAKSGSTETVYVYDDAGRNTRMTYPNGIVKDLTFDDRSFVTQIKYTKDSSVILQFDYEFDDIGNIIKKTTTWKSGKTTILDYIYDEKNQLIRVDRDGGMVSRYEYDAVGNRLLKEYALFEPSSGGGVGGVNFGLNKEGKFATITYNYNADNELLSASDIRFEFDKNGNMTAKIDPEKGRTEYTYNRADRLYKITAPDGTETRFYYDARGLRYKKVDHNGAETLFYYGSGSIPPILSERLKSPASSDESGEPLTSYLPGMSAIRNANFASGTGIKGGETGTCSTFYHLTDHLGSVYYLTDEKGSIVTEYDYDEFGIPLKQISKTTIPPYNPAGYTGEPQFGETDGLVYLRNRYYEPVSGRFTRKDPIYPAQLFYYPLNPIKQVDPLGLQGGDAAWKEFLQTLKNPAVRRELKNMIYEVKPVLTNYIQATGFGAYAASGAIGVAGTAAIGGTATFISIYAQIAVQKCLYSIVRAELKRQEMLSNPCFKRLRDMGDPRFLNLLIATNEFQTMWSDCYGSGSAVNNITR